MPTNEPKEPIDLSDVVEALRPYLPSLVETIGLAGAATEDPQDASKRRPGDIRAATVGLELVTKYLTGRGSDRASRIIKELQAARASEREPAENGSGPNLSNEA